MLNKASKAWDSEDFCVTFAQANALICVKWAVCVFRPEIGTERGHCTDPTRGPDRD